MWCSPKREKKIMKAAAIWITRRLPTRVRPINPAFSLTTKHNKIRSSMQQNHDYKDEKHGELRLELKVRFVGSTYGATVAPVNVPKAPFSKIPIPCHPIPRLITWGGGGVAPARREIA